jgi:MFS transporter, DHA2 family, multidrug resistance protein
VAGRHGRGRRVRHARHPVHSQRPPAEERAQAIAAWSAVAGVAVVIGPTPGGFLLAHFAWGGVFWVNFPLVALALAAVAVVVPEIAARPAHGGPSHGGIDLVGMFASIVGLLALVDAVIEARTGGGPPLN